MKRIFTLLLFTFLALLMQAQTITIKDQETLQPLEFVTLSTDTPKLLVTTDVNGHADISTLSGAANITIRFVGYSPQVLSYDKLVAQGTVYLATNNISLNHVVVTAARWEQPKNEVPNKVTVVTRKTTLLQNPQTTADLLGASGEVFIQKSQLGGGSPMIRGFATNRLLMTIDGVRMNSAIFRSGNLQNVISLDALATERTEILFGPGSVIYGSDAIAGVMSFYSLEPRFSLNNDPLVTGSALARYSSAAQEFTGHFDVNVGWRKWSILTSFTYSDFNDLRMGSHGPEEYLRPNYQVRIDSLDHIVQNEDPQVQVGTGYSQINLMQKLRFKPNEKWDLQYTLQYATTSNFGRYDRLIRYRNGYPRSAEWAYGPQEWMMNLLSITHTGNNAAYDKLSIRLAHQYFEESRIDRDFNDPERRTRLEQVNAYSLNFDFLKTLGARHKLFYGLEGIINDVNSSGTDLDIVTGEEVEGPARYPQATWSSYAAYVTYEYKPITKLSLSGGLRYNQYLIDAEFDTSFYPFPFTTAQVNNGAVTGSVGIAYRPTDTWSLSLNFSTGFRAPNVDDLGKVFDSEPGSVVVPNPGLEAEYVYNIDLGIAKTFGDFLELNLTGYYTFLDNALVRRDFTLNGQDSILYDGELSQVQAIQNAANAKVYGIEAGFTARLPLGFGLSARFNYQHGEEELENGQVDRLRHAAPMFGAAHVTYGTRKLRLDLYLMFSGEVSFDNMPAEERSKDFIYAMDEEGNPYSPAWYTLNLKASYQVTDFLAATAGVENLTDRRYRPYTSGIVGAGRNFILALRANF